MSTDVDHWLRRIDATDSKPYDTRCDCDINADINADHYVNGDLVDLAVDLDGEPDGGDAA